MESITNTIIQETNSVYMKFGQWIEQTLAFADESGPGSEKSRHEADELRYEQPNDKNLDRLPQEDESRLTEPSVEYPVRLPWEDEPRQVGLEIENSVNLPFEGETEVDSDGGNSLPQPTAEESEFESETGNLITLPLEDESGFEDESEQEEPNFENSYNVPQSLRYHRYDYIQVCRGRRSCLYRQTLGEKTTGFEVFKICIQPETTLGGKVYPARERWPKDDDFGKTAWTYWLLEQAMERFNELDQ